MRSFAQALLAFAFAQVAMGETCPSDTAFSCDTPVDCQSCNKTLRKIECTEFFATCAINALQEDVMYLKDKIMTAGAGGLVYESYFPDTSDALDPMTDKLMLGVTPGTDNILELICWDGIEQGQIVNLSLTANNNFDDDVKARYVFQVYDRTNGKVEYSVGTFNQENASPKALTWNVSFEAPMTTDDLVIRLCNAPNETTGELYPVMFDLFQVTASMKVFDPYFHPGLTQGTCPAAV